MSDSPRRLILRVSLKLFALTGLLLVTLPLIRSCDDGEAEPGVAPLHLPLATIPIGEAQRLTWQGGALQVLRIDATAAPLIFFDRGGTLNCPLRWYPAGASDAPSQPWIGGFRDQCSNTWYEFDGRQVAGESAAPGLQSPPYYLDSGNLLHIGVNGDNAPVVK